VRPQGPGAFLDHENRFYKYRDESKVWWWRCTCSAECWEGVQFRSLQGLRTHQTARGTRDCCPVDANFEPSIGNCAKRRFVTVSASRAHVQQPQNSIITEAGSSARLRHRLLAETCQTPEDHVEGFARADVPRDDPLEQSTVFLM
jgi:hypothetical protein